ncbi:MAG TPA: monovalent cation/H+ antiporter complex subunit F [Acidimicrobiia bacterium]
MTIAPSTLWLAGAAVFVVLGVAAGLLTVRGSVMDRVVAMQLTSTFATITLLLLAEGFDRDVYFDLAIVFAAMSFVGTLVYLRALEWWT